MARRGKSSRLQEDFREPMGESMGLGMRLLVSPAAGRLRLLPAARFQGGDEWVSAGQALAQVERGSTLVEVTSPAEARVAGVMVRDGEPVAQGQPIVWLEEIAVPNPSDNGHRKEPG